MTKRRVDAKPLKARKATPDHPIYSRGFVLGRIGRPLRPAPVVKREDKSNG
jgi:hypothetical protein